MNIINCIVFKISTFFLRNQIYIQSCVCFLCLFFLFVFKVVAFFLPKMVCGEKFLFMLSVRSFFKILLCIINTIINIIYQFTFH